MSPYMVRLHSTMYLYLITLLKSIFKHKYGSVIVTMTLTFDMVTSKSKGIFQTLHMTVYDHNMYWYSSKGTIRYDIKYLS